MFGSSAVLSRSQATRRVAANLISRGFIPEEYRDYTEAAVESLLRAAIRRHVRQMSEVTIQGLRPRSAVN